MGRTVQCQRVRAGTPTHEATRRFCRAGTKKAAAETANDAANDDSSARHRARSAGSSLLRVA